MRPLNNRYFFYVIVTIFSSLSYASDTDASELNLSDGQAASYYLEAYLCLRNRSLPQCQIGRSRESVPVYREFMLGTNRTYGGKWFGAYGFGRRNFYDHGQHGYFGRRTKGSFRHYGNRGDRHKRGGHK